MRIKHVLASKLSAPALPWRNYTSLSARDYVGRLPKAEQELLAAQRKLRRAEAEFRSKLFAYLEAKAYDKQLESR